MAIQHPNITFLMPYRWFNEDRAYLGENIRNHVMREVGKDGIPVLEEKLSYRVVIGYQYYKPVKINLTKAQVQQMLKPLFPNAKCLSVGESYMQHESEEMLPLCDFRIYC